METTAYPNITTTSPGNSSPIHPSCTDFDPVPIYAHILAIISASTSIIAAIFIIITHTTISEIRSVSRAMLIFLTIADFLTASGNIIGSIRYMFLQTSEDSCPRLRTSDGACVAQSYITTMSSMASFFWTVAIAIHIYVQISSNEQGVRRYRKLCYYNVVCWGVPVVITSVAVGMDVLGQDNSVGTGGWCWIKSGLEDGRQEMWMWLSGKAWEILCYISTGVLYLMCKFMMVIRRREFQRRHFYTRPTGGNGRIIHNEHEHEEIGVRREDENFLYVPLILYILRFWGTFRFIYALITRNVNEVDLNTFQVIFLCLQNIGDSWQAFWNFVLFCLCDNVVKARMITWWRSLCGRGPRQNEAAPLVDPVQA